MLYHIDLFAARQPSDDGDLALTRPRWIAHFNRDPSDSFQVIGRGGWESRFDDIHAEARQMMRDSIFLQMSSSRRGMFSIAEGCIEVRT